MDDLIAENFIHIRELSREIDSEIISSETTNDRLKNELAGMFAVTIVASYEGIVRSTLISYAAQFHEKYKSHVESDFSKMNARITLEHLRNYSKKFGLPQWTGEGAKKNSTEFDRLLKQRREIVERRFRKDLITSYNNLFVWRHAYAHDRATPATLKDVYESHRVGQFVIKTFVEAFRKN